MKECFKRVSVFFVALTIVTTFSFPAAAFAESPEQGTGSALTGKCGSSATYEVDRSAGTLTISGSGMMTAVMKSAAVPVGFEQSWIDQGVRCLRGYSAGSDNRLFENGTCIMNKEAHKTADGIYYYINDYSNSSDAVIFKYTGNDSELTIPDTIDDHKVTEIEKGVFSGCNSLTRVSIGKNVKVIGDSAFSGCTSLKSVTLPDGLERLSYEAFSGCSNLESITMPADLKTIEGYAFDKCSRLKEIALSESVTTIGSRAFQGTGLKTVDIPPAVTAIGYRAFYDCRQLTEVRVDSDDCNWSADNLKLCPALKYIYGHYNTSTYYDFRTDPRLKVVINDEDMKITLTGSKFEYSGKDVEPAVRIKGLKSGTDYKVSYENNDRPGVGSAVIKGKGTYYGTVTKEFIILPQRASIRKISTRHKRSAKITWKRDDRATGYQISVSTEKYSTSVVATINRNKTVTYTKTRLQTGNTYYVKVRAFVKNGNVRHFGDWSAVKKCRVR